MRDRAPEWSDEMRIWNTQRDQVAVAPGAMRRETVESANFRGPLFNHLVPEPPKERFGSAELRGKPTMTVVVGIHSDPYWRIGGKITLQNRMTLQVRRKRMEGRDSVEWAQDAFRALCERLDPVWGSISAQDEWFEKPMGGSQYGGAPGVDFDRFLPGLFAVNFFGAPYCELMGIDRILSTPADVNRCGQGALLVVCPEIVNWATDEMRERNALALDHLGPRYFYSPNPTAEFCAPVWM